MEVGRVYLSFKCSEGGVAKVLPMNSMLMGLKTVPISSSLSLGGGVLWYVIDGCCSLDWASKCSKGGIVC